MDAKTLTCSPTYLPPRLVGLAGPARLTLIALVLVATLPAHSTGQERTISQRDEKLLDRIPFDGRAAIGYLDQICEIGPRITGSKGMEQQQRFLQEHFEKLGGKVEYQSFEVKHPESGRPVTVKNMIVTWHPDRDQRVLICAHYDTRPFPDQDPRNPRGEFIGANDGASGAALMCELGKHMKDLKRLGVDFVLFDAEEFVFDRRRDPLFLGSTHFAEQYAKHPPEHRYLAGVLVDMVADANLELYYEQNSVLEARDVTRSIWGVADSLKVREFIPRVRHTVRDDHLPLNQIAKIPTCDIIDFDYPSARIKFSYWHTMDDTPDKCSPVSLAKVGWVLHEWLSRWE